MRTMLVLLIGAALGFGCRDDHRQAIEAKCDAPLRERAEQLAKAGESTPIEVMGRANATIDDALSQRLTAAGAQLGQVSGELFTARIPVPRLGYVAALPFVTSLQLSQTRDPLETGSK